MKVHFSGRPFDNYLLNEHKQRKPGRFYRYNRYGYINGRSADFLAQEILPEDEKHFRSSTNGLPNVFFTYARFVGKTIENSVDEHGKLLEIQAFTLMNYVQSTEPVTTWATFKCKFKKKNVF